jgi:hypothetical protein
MYANIENDLSHLKRDLEDYTYSYEVALSVKSRPSTSTMGSFASEQVTKLPGLIDITNQQIATLVLIKTQQSVTQEQLNLLTETPSDKSYTAFPEYKSYAKTISSMLATSSTELTEAGPSVPTSSTSATPTRAHSFFRMKSFSNLKKAIHRPKRS